jgi:hypothetical protein
MFKIPQKDNFALKQVKILNEALEFKGETRFAEDEEVFINNLNDKYVYTPHEDLTDNLLHLKRPLAELCGLIDAETLIEASEFGATAQQKKSLKTYLNIKLNDVNVTGIALSGEGGRYGVKITGTYKGQSIVSPKIFIGKEEDLELFQNEVKEIVTAIVDETYKYIFEGKKASLEDFFNSDQQSIDGTGDDFKSENMIED